MGLLWVVFFFSFCTICIEDLHTEQRWRRSETFTLVHLQLSQDLNKQRYWLLRYSRVFFILVNFSFLFQSEYLSGSHVRVEGTGHLKTDWRTTIMTVKVCECSLFEARLQQRTFCRLYSSACPCMFFYLYGLTICLMDAGRKVEVPHFGWGLFHFPLLSDTTSICSGFSKIEKNKNKTPPTKFMKRTFCQARRRSPLDDCVIEFQRRRTFGASSFSAACRLLYS